MRKLEPSERRTLLIIGVGLVLNIGCVWAAARVPNSAHLQQIVNANCPHWTEC